MGEYDRRQQKQGSRAIAYNGGGNKQLKGIVDKRNQAIQMWRGSVVGDKIALNIQARARMSSLKMKTETIDQLLGDPGEDNILANVQKHHIIPRELCRKEFTGTFLDNFETNGILLPSTPMLSQLMGRIAHTGSHPRYTQSVENLLRSKVSRPSSANSIINRFLEVYPPRSTVKAVKDTITEKRAELKRNNPGNKLE